MKVLKYCVHGDGNLVCPPSKVLCKECQDEITSKMEKMLTDLKQNPDWRKARSGIE